MAELAWDVGGGRFCKVQLEKIVCGGADKVDARAFEPFELSLYAEVNAIRSGSEVEGWTAEEESDYLPWFWEVLASFTPAEKAHDISMNRVICFKVLNQHLLTTQVQFVVFVTASDRVPLKGWQALGLLAIESF